MAHKIDARNVTLRDLDTKFALQLVRDTQFFPEWQSDLPDITDIDKQLLDQVQDSYFNLMEYPPVLENTIQIAVLSPLLHLAGFLGAPFHIKSEESIQISALDDEVTIDGKIDVLVLSEQLWLIVIESKQAAFSIETGLAQLLAYMLASPHPERPTFGMITTGDSSIFVKLVKNGAPQYGLSRVFELRNPGNDLLAVLAILKRLGQLVKPIEHGFIEKVPTPQSPN